jgi:outer membrane protein OmpA-like peptidoglycan-associated protein
MTFLLSKLRPLWILIASLALGACASPRPLSQVTLLPDAQGRTTSVLVTTSQGTQVLTAPYQVAQVDRKLLVRTAQTTPEAVNKAHPALVNGLSRAPQSFVLYFQPGTSTLTTESLAALPTVLAAARQRPGGEIVITGHTDRQGSLEANDRLSLQRAQVIRTLMQEQGFQADLIEARGRGEREPVVATEDEVAEPRNRRAEVLVR